MNKIFFFTVIIFSSISAQSLNMSGYNSDPLSETPLYPIPSEMSFEEYKDMNRRLSQALGWSAIPIPGITHYYAGEKKIAKRILFLIFVPHPASGNVLDFKVNSLFFPDGNRLLFASSASSSSSSLS